MKLYYSPGACSLAPHIILRELDIDFDLIQVDLRSKKTEFGDDFYAINPHGRVPALQIDEQEVLTESVAILQYLADQNPLAQLAPENATLERARLQEAFNFLTSDLHKSFSPLFAGATDEEKPKLVETIESHLNFANNMLQDKSYLTGDSFSIADAYLFVLSSWAIPTGIDLDKWPNLAAFFARITERKSVQEAMQVEGLLG